MLVATVARKGLSKGFSLTSSLLILQATTQLQKYTTFACCFADPYNFQRSFQRLLKSATIKPHTSRATNLDNTRQEESTGRVRLTGQVQAAFRRLTQLSTRRAMPKNNWLYLEGGCSTGVCCKEEGEPKCCT